MYHTAYVCWTCACDVYIAEVGESSTAATPAADAGATGGADKYEAMRKKIEQLRNKFKSDDDSAHAQTRDDSSETRDEEQQTHDSGMITFPS